MPMVPEEDESVTESESEVDEDAATSGWMRPGVSGRGRQHSLGGGACLVPASMGRSGGTSPVRVPGERRGAAAGFQGFLLPSLCDDRYMRQSTVTSG